MECFENAFLSVDQNNGRKGRHLLHPRANRGSLDQLDTSKRTIGYPGAIPNNLSLLPFLNSHQQLPSPQHDCRDSLSIYWLQFSSDIATIA